MSDSEDIHIGVDARPLSHPGTGIYRYTKELLLRMCSRGGRWYFYSSQPYDQSDFCQANIVHRVVNVPSLLGGSQASQLLFPRWIRRDAIDVFWGPRHHFPVFIPPGISAVLTVHDLVWMQQPASMRASRRLMEASLMPRSLRRADQVVTGTHYVADELLRAFSLAADKLNVISYGSCFEPDTCPLAVRAEQASYFLFVGTMEPRKNLPKLISAYNCYVNQCADAKRLIIVGGEGWGGIDPHQLVVKYGLSDMVEVLGRVPEAELSQLYAGAYALLMPSLYEGFGLPIVEAMAHGVPALVSQDSAMSEVAADAGYVVDPASEKSIADGLSMLTNNSALIASLRRSVGVRAQAFSWDIAAIKMHHILLQAR